MERIVTNIKIAKNELDFSDEENSSDEESIKKSSISQKKIKENVKKKIFMDEDEESEDDEEPIKKIPVIRKSHVKAIIGDKNILNYIIPDANNYEFKTWKQCFPKNIVYLRSLIFNNAWDDFFNMIERKSYFNKMEKILSKYLVENNHIILPHAELVFNAFNVLSPDKISVVIIGQDPYPGGEKINDKFIPNSTGFCFSAPANYPKPMSLKNIFDNLHRFGHIRSIPDSGCLSPWIMQGCFMINASLTTFYKSKNSHRTLWKSFTDDLISYLNDKFENLVFLVWGKDAHIACKYINPKKHFIITSSHPSPLGYNKTMNGWTYGIFKDERDRIQLTYQPFEATDHFGKANNYLKSVGKREIFWDTIN